MAIQECVYYTLFSVHSLLQYTVSVTYTKFLYIDMTIALKSLNEIQQTVSMRLTILPHDITVIYVTYFQMYYYLSQCMRFPTIWYVRPAKPQISLRIRAV